METRWIRVEREQLALGLREILCLLAVSLVNGTRCIGAVCLLELPAVLVDTPLFRYLYLKYWYVILYS